MYCNRCGAALSPGAQYCTGCGERVLGLAPTGHPVVQTTMVVGVGSRVRRHGGLLAALWMVNGVLRLLEILSFSPLGRWFLPNFLGRHTWGVWGLPSPWNAWPLALGWTWIAMGLGVFGVVHLILAWGLYERMQWARPLGLAIGFLALLRFPLGTALGIYTLWVLLPEMSAREYERIAVP